MTSYTNSIYDGVDKLIQRMYAECNQTQFVLTGYSQGALSIHLALRQLAISDPSMLNRVAGVGLVADPGRTINGGETVWGGANQPASWLVGGSAGVQASFLVGDSSLSGPLPQCSNPAHHLVVPRLGHGLRDLPTRTGRAAHYLQLNRDQRRRKVDRRTGSTTALTI